MYTDEDIVRSVRRYVSLMLGQPWNIMLERQEVRDDARPAGLIEIGETHERFSRVAVPQGERTMFAPLTIALFPPVYVAPLTNPPEPLNPRVTGRAARQLAARVRDLIAVGAAPAGDPQLFRANGRPACGPARMPLWDYQSVAPGTAGPQKPHDVLWAEDWTVDAVQDPEDARRWSVMADVRVSWEATGAVPPVGVVVGRFKVKPPAVPPDPATKPADYLKGQATP